ncbi:unnamed protein product [Didymodactylos carnosus]|uniref:Mab-21-like HhH/H2TH-like domain-containing protein n=1 Tax=Didymodactylos carnosus TaxID=1234261 RepID=A0A813RVQ4_9BILA|nr:unnamed protein product [Didymodactylos carnosus]CAF1602864.1 unnamed protein product [Didymodactylos carnosus]CAF3574391.1 unnamed protein product [Didymodactylos carnosus]CAF4412321.1 unnamed protein product [Didymodactylos carnosus]
MVGHKPLVYHQTFLWRISTTPAEVNFFQKLSLEKKYGYTVLKTLRNCIPYQCIVNNIVYSTNELLTSYTLKMIYLHEVEKYPNNHHWLNQNLCHRVMSLFKRLYKNFQLGKIQSYYIQNYNILDCEEFEILRSHMLKYVQLIVVHLKETLLLNTNPVRPSH